MLNGQYSFLKNIKNLAILSTDTAYLYGHFFQYQTMASKLVFK